MGGERTGGEMKWLRAVGFVISCQLVGGAGAFFTSPDSAWYQSLEKPFFQPPSWLFGPVWIALYFLMGIAAFLVNEKRPSDPRARPALAWFAAQLVLNGLWTPLFFGAQLPLVALVVLVALVFVLLMTIIRFHAVRPSAAWLLIPYQLWVTFAAALNAAIVYLN